MDNSQTSKNNVNRVKCCYIMTILFVIFILSVLKTSTFFEARPKSVLIPRSVPRTDTNNKTITILAWTLFFNYKWNGILQMHKSSHCEYSNCRLIYNKNRLKTSDALLFHGRDIKIFHDLPKEHPTKQNWIYFLLESPTHTPNVKAFHDVFNATMTYRTDSDIWAPYGKFAKRIPSKVRQVYEFGNWNKTKTIAWVVSNCKTNSRRERYVRELQRFIPVDIYGACGKLKCGGSRRDHDGCGEIIERDYHFYLSFENSVCKDYATEKVWKTLKRDIVPIVLGGADYEKLLPPHSHINIKDFASPKSLAEHLNSLINNTQLYRKYFDWKMDFQVLERNNFCYLCKFLNENKDRFHSINLHKFWTENTCISAQDYYKNVGI